MKNLLILIALLCSHHLVMADPLTPITKDSSIEVLIVDGFNNHDWQASTKIISEILQQDKAINLAVSTVPAKGTDAWEKWLPIFSDYDVVVQNTNDISKKGAWPRTAQLAFEKYVSSGGGMLVFHSANNAFPLWLEYNKMIGLGWRRKTFGKAITMEQGEPVFLAAGEGDKTSHGKRHNVLVTRYGDHPIHQGLAEKWLAADLEVYRYARGPAENLEVLSYAKEGKTGLYFPIEWTVSYGKGRVYNSTYGHHWHDVKEVPAGMRCMAFRTLMLRATRWLAKAPIDAARPENFPTEEKISLLPLNE
ncbi:MAG: ThuA domain-containing protein [Akkermansiaceae bacterium]